ncbi:ribbon-helix-helix protein, CopG family [Pantoea sp. A4]|uniref:ribbon-helix-helix protein, CopG family n=1 Tax=Pantoea sp. A4 TaxID=1225184 RepID=UPI00037679D2|nr:ribbon-helix-helix protein, CopG family [Pantoea sp. A4]
MSKSRISVTLTPEIDEMLEQVSRSQNISKSHAIRRAFALLQIAEEERQKGRELGIIKDEGGSLKAVGKIVGINRG